MCVRVCYDATHSNLHSPYCDRQSMVLRKADVLAKVARSSILMENGRGHNIGSLEIGVEGWRGCKVIGRVRLPSYLVISLYLLFILSLSHYLSIYLSTYLYLSLSNFLSLSHYLSHSLSQSLSLSFSFSLFLSLSLYLPISLNLSLHLRH